MTSPKDASNDKVSRRGFSIAAGTAALTAGVVGGGDASAQSPSQPPSQSQPSGTAEATSEVNATNGRLKQSVCKWCYSKMSLEEMATLASSLGMVGIDLLDPPDFPTLKKHGLICTMVQSHPLSDGLCDPQFHSMAIEKTLAAIEATAEAGFPNVICFSGNARGIDRETGMKNCVAALAEIVPTAEAKGVTVQMELLNSKVNHPDYMCDNSTWGVELCKRVGSDNFKLLYDIYHMQIMEGDVIRTIENHHEFFGHYHTAGNPGRHELDDQQELFYPPIAKAIAETGFDGFFAHEFIPKGDPVAGLTDAVRQCIV